MVWAAIGGAAIGVVGGLLQKKAGDKNAQQAQQMSEADKQFYRDQYNQSVKDNRVNQSNDFGSQAWTQDPKTGQWSQTNTLNPAEQSRLQDYRQIAADRMRAAGGINLDYLSKPLNYNTQTIGPNVNGGSVGNPTYARDPGLTPIGGGAQQGGNGYNGLRPGQAPPSSAGGNMLGPPPMAQDQNQGNAPMAHAQINTMPPPAAAPPPAAPDAPTAPGAGTGEVSPEQLAVLRRQLGLGDPNAPQVYGNDGSNGSGD